MKERPNPFMKRAVFKGQNREKLYTINRTWFIFRFFVLIDLKPLKLWVTDLVVKSINILGLKTLDPLPRTRR